MAVIYAMKMSCMKSEYIHIERRDHTILFPDKTTTLG